MNSPFTQPNLMSPENEPETVKSILLEKYERCSFCNSRLLFNHDLNLMLFEIVETSRCSGCGVTMNPRKYKVH